MLGGGPLNVDVSQLRSLFTDVCVTLVTHRFDVKRGSSASLLFRYVRFNSKYPENSPSRVLNNNGYLFDNIKCKYNN